MHLSSGAGLGKLIDFRPYGNGHINDTFLVRYENDDLKTDKVHIAEDQQMRHLKIPNR